MNYLRTKKNMIHLAVVCSILTLFVTLPDMAYAIVCERVVEIDVYVFNNGCSGLEDEYISFTAVCSGEVETFSYGYNQCMSSPDIQREDNANKFLSLLLTAFSLERGIEVVGVGGGGGFTHLRLK